MTGLSTQAQPRTTGGPPTPDRAARRAAWATLVLVLAGLALAGPFSGRTTEVEENGPTSQLPRGFDSTQVEDELATFARDAVQPAVVVYERPGGLTAADRDAIADDRSAAEGLPTRDEVAPTELSDDGAAALTVVGLDLSDDGAFDDLAALRDSVDEGLPDGLEAEVTGPVATSYDTFSVFDGVNTKILGASAVVVALLLLLTYRSPVLWLLPLVSIGVAVVGSDAVIYGLAQHAGLAVDGQSGGIVPILVFGVGTDYALLLIARYREELHLHADRFRAVRVALRRSVAPIVASATTVVLGLACLMLADMNSTRSLGAVCAVGVASAAVAMLVALPVLLAFTGRWVFWPFVPRPDHLGESEDQLPPARRWRLVAGLVSRRPRLIWVGSALTLAALALGTLGTTIGSTNAERFRETPDSVLGQETIARHFPSGSAAPAVVLADAAKATDVGVTLRATDGVSRVGDPVPSRDADRVMFEVVLTSPSDSSRAEATIGALRERLDPVDPGALVGGPTAQTVDVKAATAQDIRVVVPAVLAVVLLVLVLLLRAALAPLMLLATVVLSFAAGLGAGALAMSLIGYDSLDISLPLLAFVFLVALGVDYTIFLMSRVREEVARHGHQEGIRRGLVATGGVITSAGIVLAATFSVLTVMPITFMVGLGLVVALGILLDTFIVRSLMVPALALDVGPRMWWPRRPDPG